MDVKLHDTDRTERDREGDAGELLRFKRVSTVLARWVVLPHVRSQGSLLTSQTQQKKEKNAGSG